MCGELLTEGYCRVFDASTNERTIVHHFVVREPHHAIPLLPEFVVSHAIIFSLFIVDRAIDFDDEAGFDA